MKRNQSSNADFLDKSIIKKFREVIISSHIFDNLENYKNIFNLICVFMDRITDASRYLNEKSETPKNEDDFIIFLVYASILRDGIYKLYENVFHKKPPYINEKKYFSNAMEYNKPFFTEENCPTDDSFFEYMRAMTFAHPYEVSGRESSRPYMNNGEKHYCPWVIVQNNYITALSGFNDAVGFRIYSSESENSTTDIMISFSALKDYLKSRYESIAELTTWAENGVNEQNKIWMKRKVNRNQQPEEILKEILSILEERFESSYAVETALCFLECPLSKKQNEQNVSIYKSTIIQAIPAVCDCIDTLNYENIEKSLFMLYIRPRKMHKEAHYQLQKIDSYLTVRSEHIDPNSNEYWGLKQASDFSKEFAKDWVDIDVCNMPYDEIKLLVHTACYLEAVKQYNAHKHK